MYYYKVLENEILKYEVSYDLEKVRGLLKDLVRDCSEEKTYHYTSVGIPKRDPYAKYKKFDYKFVDIRYDFYGDDEIYEVDAIELITPSLYILIINILNGNVIALEELFSKRIDMTNKKDEKDLDYYYDAFQHLFNVTLVDKMDISLYERVREFMGLSKLENKNDLSLTLNRK